MVDGIQVIIEWDPDGTSPEPEPEDDLYSDTYSDTY